jgi:hypothetical protein
VIAGKGEFMKITVALLILAALSGLAHAQMLEPDTDNVFYALAHDPDRLIALERQTATIHTSAKWVGIGATAKSSSQLKPAKSPVRVNNAKEFVVRSPFANTTVDFNSFYVLRSLASKGGKRELVISKTHAYMGVGSSTSNLAEGEVPVTITKYGVHSLKITPAQPLHPGEYALSGRSAFLNLFCFGVDE